MGSRDFKNIDQMIRLTKFAGEKSVEEYRKTLKEGEQERKRQQKLNLRIQEEGFKNKVERIKKTDPIKYKALQELMRLWKTGKQGFVSHLYHAYKAGKAKPLLVLPKDATCSLTKVKLKTLVETVTDPEGLTDDLSKIIEGSTMEAHGVLKEMIFAVQGKKTDTLLCYPALEGLMEFIKEKMDTREFDPRRKKKEENNQK